VKIPFKIVSLLFIAALCVSAAAQTPASSAKVFQVGVFDGASNEFAGGAPKQPVDFDANSGNAATGWYAFQSAAGNEPPAKNGSVAAAAPRAIRFNVSAAPAFAYRLHVALLIESLSVPALRVCVAEKCGKFYLQSALSGQMGLSDDTFESVHAPADLFFDFPGSYMHSGSNTITFQAVEGANPLVPQASLTYDAIELDAAPGADLSSAPSAEIQPTVFYRGQPGSLTERVDVFVRRGEKIEPGGDLVLTLAGKQYRQAFREAGNFGEERFEFFLPEFAPGTLARLEWSAGDRQFKKELTIDPRKKWTLFLVPHSHLDIGYSDYQSKVAAVQSRAIDEGIDMAERVPGFSYSVDGSWVLDQFMKTRSAADQQRAIQAMRDGKLFVPAQYAELLTGFPSAETMIRSLYASARFSRLHGTPFNYANITDVPSYSGSYPSILAAAGIQYFVAGPNGHETRAPVLLQGRLNENSPFWWVGPDGGKVVFWYARHYFEGGILFGTPPEIAAGLESVPLFLRTYERANYRANAVILFGTQQENTDLFPQQAQLAGQWNQEFAYPKIVYSGFHDALKNIADQFGNGLPTVTGDGGPYWEDGIASNARYAAIERGNESRAPSAEKLATLSALVNPRIAADRSQLDEMWTNMVLMDEHTFNSHDSWSDPGSEETARQSEVKNQYAVKAANSADFVARASMSSLADSISAGPNSLIVFNTLNWKRSALADFDLNNGLIIFDRSTSQPVPFQVVSQSAKLRRVRFLAAEIPAFGYKVFELRPSRQPDPIAEAGHAAIIESPFYRVELDPASGAVRGIYDKELRRELVNKQSPYRFGQYLYVVGGDERPNTLLQYRSVRLQPKLQVDAARDGRLLAVTRTPDGWTARMQSADTNTPAIVTEIRLFDREKKIEFVEDVDKTEVKSREGVYFAFPFAMDRPQFQYEIQTGIVDPTKDMYPGAGHEWFSVQHWASVQQDGLSATVMPLDASLVTLGDIYRGAWPKQFGVRPGTIFSFTMNNYWSTNYNAGQGGHFRFRYVVTSASSTRASALSRMGWEEATPLELNEVTRQDKALAPKPDSSSLQASYLDVSDPAVLVEDWKPAEDGNGTILRLLDLGGIERQVTVQTPLIAITRAVQTDAVERDQQDLPLNGQHRIQVTVHPHQIVTIRVVGKQTPTNEVSQEAHSCL